MSGPSHENRDPVRPPSAFIGFILLVSAILATVGGAASPDPPAVSAPSLTAAIVANRMDAGRTDSLSFTAWVNLSGVAPSVEAWVNLTFAPDFRPDAANATAPGACDRVGVWSWYCGALGTGSYVWYAPATVSDRAAFITSNATVNATAYRSVYLWADATVGVAIRGADVYISIRARPAPVRPGDRVNITIEAVNDENATDSARNVRLVIEADDAFIIDPGTNRTPFASELTAGSILSTSFQASIATNATVGSQIGIRVVWVYEDYDYRSIAPQTHSLYVAVQAPEIATPSLLIAVAAFGIPILTVALVLFVLGERRIRIDEVFLMHRSGILIQHLTQGPGLRKDDDLVASMFVAIQEFVRDSFDTKATLDELSFGGRKAAVLRGEHIVLAALLSRGSPRYLFSQMKAAERALERVHGPDLAAWDGRESSLDHAGPILEALLRGRYRRFVGWRS